MHGPGIYTGFLHVEHGSIASAGQGMGNSARIHATAWVICGILQGHGIAWAAKRLYERLPFIVWGELTVLIPRLCFGVTHQWECYLVSQRLRGAMGLVSMNLKQIGGWFIGVRN